MFDRTSASLLCIIEMVPRCRLSLLRALRHLEDAILAIIRREFEILNSDIVVPVADVTSMDLHKAPASEQHPSSLLPMIVLAAACWAVVGLLVYRFT